MIIREPWRAELETFADPERKQRKPDYYLFATNVPLPGVIETGGKDRAEALFKEYQDVLGLKGWFIWDYHQIRTLLDIYPDIRTTYAAWITPGD